MSDIDYGILLWEIRPDSHWTVHNNEYEGIVWYSDDSKPTKAELDAAWPQVQYDRAYAQVELARHTAYTAPGGPDAIFLRWQRGDATEQEWLDSVQAVKDANPYPVGP